MTFWFVDCNLGYGGCCRKKQLCTRHSLVCAHLLQVVLQGTLWLDFACLGAVTLRYRAWSGCWSAFWRKKKWNHFKKKLLKCCWDLGVLEWSNWFLDAFELSVVCMAGAGSRGSLLGSISDPFPRCRWARCCGDLAADGLYQCLVMRSGSAWLKGWGRPTGAEQHGTAPSCCSPATSEALDRRKVLLVKTHCFPKRKDRENV